MEHVRIKSSLIGKTKKIFNTINGFVSKGWLNTKKKLPVDNRRIELILKRGTLLVSVLWQSYIVSRYPENRLPKKKKIRLIMKILGTLPEGNKQGLTRNPSLAKYILKHIGVLTPVFEPYLKKGYAKKTFQRGGAPEAKIAEELAAPELGAAEKVGQIASADAGKAAETSSETPSEISTDTSQTDRESRSSSGRLQNITESLEREVGPPSEEVQEFIATEDESQKPAPFNFLVPLKYWEDRLGFVLSIPLEFITGLLSFCGSTLQIIGSVMAIIPGNPSAGLFIIGAAIVFLINIFLNLARANWPIVVHSLLGMFPFILEAINGFAMFALIQKNKFEHDIKAMSWLEKKGIQLHGLAKILFPWWEPIKKMTYHD